MQAVGTGPALGDLSKSASGALVRETDRVIEDMLAAFRARRVAQVPGYAPFRYRRVEGRAVVVERRNG
jgi:hypothetical protein